MEKFFEDSESITTEEMIEAIVAQMPDEHRAFLVGVERGEIDWNLSGLTDAANLPAVRWKLANLETFRKRRPDDFAAQSAALDTGLGQS